MATNPPTYCFLWRPPPHLRPPIKQKGFKLYPRTCNGCLMPFADRLYNEPNNLIFRYRTIRQWYTPGGALRTSKKDGPKNAYYHANDMACLRRCKELERVTIDDCYIDRDCFARLTEGHKKLLRFRHHWVPLRRVRAAVMDDSD